jgi:peptidoglycan hydrolase CwlO-like protein
MKKSLLLLKIASGIIRRAFIKSVIQAKLAHHIPSTQNKL